MHPNPPRSAPTLVILIPDQKKKKNPICVAHLITGTCQTPSGQPLQRTESSPPLPRQKPSTVESGTSAASSSVASFSLEVVGGAVREAVCDSPSALWSAVTTALLTQLLALHRQWEHPPWISTGPGDSTDHRPWHGHGYSGRPHATDTNMALGCSKSNRNQHGLQGTDQTPVWSLAAPNPRRSTWLQARRQQGHPHGLHWQHGLWHLAWFLTAAQTTDIK